MTKNDFLELFIKTLEISSSDVTLDTKLDTLDEWESWSRLTLMAMVDENFQVELTSDDLKSFVTIGDIVRKIGEDKFE